MAMFHVRRWARCAVVAALVFGASVASASQQPGAGAVRDLVADQNGRVLVATAPAGMEIYDISGGPSVVPPRVGSASVGYAGERIAMTGLTLAVTIANGGGVATYEAGTILEELGHIPGKVLAVGVASNEERIIGIATVDGLPPPNYLRAWHRTGGGYLASVSLGSTPIGGMAVCGGTSASPAGSRVYVTTGTARTLRVFDGAPPYSELRPPVSLAEDGLKVECDGTRVWVSTPTQSVQHDGVTLLPTGRTAPVIGRSGYDLRGAYLYGAQYDIVRGYDVTASMGAPAYTIRGATGVAACGGWGVVCVGSAATGNTASYAGLHVLSLTGALPTPAATLTRTKTLTAIPASTATRTATQGAAMCWQYPEGSGRLVPCGP